MRTVERTEPDPGLTVRRARNVVFALSTFGSGSRSNTDEFHVFGGTPFLITPYQYQKTADEGSSRMVAMRTVRIGSGS